MAVSIINQQYNCRVNVKEISIFFSELKRKHLANTITLTEHLKAQCQAKQTRLTQNDTTLAWTKLIS